MDDILGGRPTTTCKHTVSSLPTPLQASNNIIGIPGDSLDDVDAELLTASSSNESSKRKMSTAVENKKAEKKSKMQFNDFVIDYFTEKRERAMKAEEEKKEKEEAKKEMFKKKLELEERKLDLFAKLLDKIQ